MRKKVLLLSVALAASLFPSMGETSKGQPVIIHGPIRVNGTRAVSNVIVNFNEENREILYGFSSSFENVRVYLYYNGELCDFVEYAKVDPCTPNILYTEEGKGTYTLVITSDDKIIYDSSFDVE
jgi:hypothetical protein